MTMDRNSLGRPVNMPQESMSNSNFQSSSQGKLVVEQIVVRPKNTKSQEPSRRMSVKSLSVISSSSSEDGTGQNEQEAEEYKINEKSENSEVGGSQDRQARSNASPVVAFFSNDSLLDNTISQTPIGDKFTFNTNEMPIQRMLESGNISQVQTEDLYTEVEKTPEQMISPSAIVTPEETMAKFEDGSPSKKSFAGEPIESVKQQEVVDKIVYDGDSESKPNNSRTRLLIIVLSVLFVTSLAINIYIGHHAIKSMMKKEESVPLPKPILQPTFEINEKIPGYELITKDDFEVNNLLSNPDLRRVFYGIDYAPLNVQHPECGTTQREVTLDITVLSQLTNRIRLYGTDCYQADFVLNAIQDLGLNMTISLGVWVDRSYEGSNRQLQEMKRILESYPTKYIDSILVGNEVLFRQDMTQHELISHIETARAYLKSKNIKIPVGTSEIGAKWNAELASHVDILAANIHPFFGGVPVNMSTKWTYDFLYDQIMVGTAHWDVVPSRILISEVGWPTGGGRIRGSLAGIQELQVLLENWLCYDHVDDIGWYWFEAFDEPWKRHFAASNQQWETQWGLLGPDRKLKDGVKLPNCTFV